MEWWLNNAGLNLLSGVVGDESNPARLSDEQILDFVRRIPAARESFNRLVPQMLEEEQDRLRLLAISAQYPMPDLTACEDKFQASQNRAGVRTSGPRGGKRIGGNR